MATTFFCEFLLLTFVVSCHASSCDSTFGGVCLNSNTDYCPGGYVSGYCSGASHIKCCKPDTSSKCVTDYGGVCQDSGTEYCTSSHLSGKCPGASQYKCCRPDTTSSCATSYAGTCQDSTVYACANTYLTGKCPGSAEYKCCVGGATSDQISTHAAAWAILDAAGFTISSSGNCNDRNNPSCTSLTLIREISIAAIVKFKEDSGCDIRITGGTETGHSSSTYSHWNGWKIDIALDANCVDPYITDNYEFVGNRGDGAAQYRDSAGYIWANESNHWDIRFHE